MGRKLMGLSLLIVFFISNLVWVPEAKSAATIPLSITVNGSLVITDAANDTMAGKDPTKNVTLSVTPDLGAATVSGTAGIRLRTNNSAWRLTTTRTATTAGGTGIADADVKVDIATSAGANASATAGARVAPFNAQTNLTAYPVPPAVAADVISGTAKTSTMLDNSNSANYFQVDTTFSIAPDFFYAPGTLSTTITYNLVSP